MNPLSRLYYAPKTLFAVALIFGSTTRATDWPQYRGAAHDGVSADRIKTQWDVDPPVEMWRVACSNGYSSFALAGGRAYTLVTRNNGTGDKETCIALDAETGAELWARPVGAGGYGGGPGTPDDGPRSTPSVQGGRVFVLSSFLALSCLNAADGSTIWSKDLVALYGARNISWQNAASPLVADDLIFVNCNTASQSLFAFRTADGSLAWRSQSAPMTHSTPVATSILGMPQVVFAAQNGLVSLNRTNGALLWQAPYPFSFNTSLAASPVVYSNLVFITANYTMGSFATRIQLAGGVFSAMPAWTNSTFNYRSHWMTPVCCDGYLYGMFGSAYNSPLMCIDMRTGSNCWSKSNFGRGGTILVNNHVLALSEKGDLVLINPDPAAYTELARFSVFPNYDAYTNKCWNVPAVCDGRIYVRSSAEGVALDVSIPALRMLPPRLLPANKIQLRIGTETGAPLDASRAANIQVRWTDNPATPADAWTPLAGGVTLTNGEAVLETDLGGAAGFYVATEPP